MVKRGIQTVQIVVLIILIFGFVTAFSEGAEQEEKIGVIVFEKNITLGLRTMGKTADIDENKIEKRFETFNGFSGKFTKEEIEEMKKDPSKEVFFEKKYFVTLDGSIPLIGADSASRLNVNGINLTGAGQTVCIIDTGVNYLHDYLGGCYGNNDPSSSCKILGGYDYVNDDAVPLDDHGHGTHVAGIISSTHPTYRGVAPATKIIAIKALDEGGSGYSSDIIAGIDWCISNSSKFNISVISMSLGDCSNHSTYCNSDQFASSINFASSKNITVVVSSGNGDTAACRAQGINVIETEGISSPACIQSSLAVGAVDYSDNIFYQRGPLFQVLAPGIDIYSTYQSAFASSSGTSMSAPHVSGAVAIMQQLSKGQRGKSYTVNQIKYALNNSGVSLYDSDTGYSFSRIDVFNTVLSLDEVSPSVTLVSPVDGEVNTSRNKNFFCNFTDWQLENATIKIWNSTGLYYNTTKSSTGTTNQSLFNLSNFSEGNYEWNCLVYDSENNYAFSAENFSFTVGGVDVNLVSPSNETYANSNVTFSCRSSSETNVNLTNVTLSIWNSSELIYNETKNITGTVNISNFSYNLSDEGNYEWNCLSSNDNLNSSVAEYNFSITYDLSSPLISNILTDAEINSATITWNTNEPANSSISLGGNSSEWELNHSISLVGLSPTTTYNFNITSCDRAGNCANKSSYFVTDVASVQSDSGDTEGSGGSGGSGGTAAEKIYELNNGEELNILVGKNAVIFKIDEEEHGIRLIEYTKDSANLTLQSETFDIYLNVSENKKINLSSPDYYDLNVRLNAITYGKADITLTRIFERIKSPEENEDVKVGIMTGDDIVDEEIWSNPRSALWPLLTVGIIIIIEIICVTWLISQLIKRFSSSKRDGKGKKITKA